MDDNKVWFRLPMCTERKAECSLAREMKHVDRQTFGHDLPTVVLSFFVHC
jgi:hypothetical protein